MTKVAWFSTDWQFEPAVDELASRVAGRPIPIPGKRVATYGGTYYYRMALPAMELAKHGYQSVLAYAVRPGPDGRLSALGVDQCWHDDCDIVVFQRWMAANGAPFAERARAAGQLVIQDVDDMFWALPRTNIASQTTDPKVNPEFNRVHYRRMIDVSSAVICSTPAIAAYLGRKVPAFVCRNSIDIDRWPVHDPMVGMVGWVGGIAWRGNDLPLLRGVLGPFLEEHGLPFYHGGHSGEPGVPAAWDQLGINPARVRCMASPIVKIAEYPRIWDPVGLALVPLEDCTFNRGKSWLKGLEASACGIPFVASRLPEYEALGVGRLAKTPGEWRQHLDELLDPEVRRVEGLRNRARAEELSVGKQWHQWDRVFRDLGAGPNAGDPYLDIENAVAA